MNNTIVQYYEQYNSMNRTIYMNSTIDIAHTPKCGELNQLMGSQPSSLDKKRTYIMYVQISVHDAPQEQST